MPSLDLVTKFILSFLDSICTIYISSYSMKNYQSIIHLCQSLHGIRTTIQTSPFLFSLVVDSPALLLGFHPSSWLPPFLTPTSASSSPYSTYIMAQEQHQIAFPSDPALPFTLINISDQNIVKLTSTNYLS